MNKTQLQSGFSAVEAVVSMAVLSVAMVGFLSAMTAATKVSNEELAESDMQAETRKLTEELTRDMDSASICYIQPWSAATLGTAITTSDTDNTNNSWLLLRYQFVVSGADPNTATPGVINSTYGLPSFSLDASGIPIITYGAAAPGTSTLVPGSCYTLVFKQDRIQKFIQEVDPATNPATIPGTKYIFKDLDGDGAYTSKFVVGHIERRYSPVFSSASPSVTGPTDPVEKEYTSPVMLEWDGATNSPKNTILRWLQDPGSSASTGPYFSGPLNNPSACVFKPYGFSDNCYHVMNAGKTDAVPGKDPTNANVSWRYPNNWGTDVTNGNKQWDPILNLSLRFLVQPDDGRATNSGARMKIATTSIFMRGQAK